MNTTESLGYLKGLLDGLDFDENKKETKMFKAIVDVLENIIEDIDDVNEDMDLLAEQVDGIDTVLLKSRNISQMTTSAVIAMIAAATVMLLPVPPAARSLWSMKIPLWRAALSAPNAVNISNLR